MIKKLFLSTALVIAMGVMIPQKAEAIVYGLKSLSIGGGPGAAPPTNLYSFEEDGSSFTNFGALQLAGADIDGDGLAINSSGDLFGFSLNSQGSTLISITPNVSEVTPIGSMLTDRQIRGAVFQNNDLWAIDSRNNELLQIDPNSGAIIGMPQELSLNGSPYNLGTPSDIAVDTNNSFYLVILNTLFSLDITTAELSSANTINGGYVGATFSDNANDDTLFLFEVNGNDDIFTTSVDTLTTTLLLGDIIPEFNSGRGDLAALVTVTPSQSVPEPSTIISLAMVGGGLLLSKRVKRG